MRHPDDYDDDDYFDDEESFNRQWNDPKNHTQHTCKGCGATFGAHYSRGPLAYCDGCADRIEQGWDI